MQSTLSGPRTKVVTQSQKNTKSGVAVEADNQDQKKPVKKSGITTAEEAKKAAKTAKQEADKKMLSKNPSASKLTAGLSQSQRISTKVSANEQHTTSTSRVERRNQSSNTSMMARSSSLLGIQAHTSFDSSVKKHRHARCAKMDDSSNISAEFGRNLSGDFNKELPSLSKSKQQVRSPTKAGDRVPGFRQSPLRINPLALAGLQHFRTMRDSQDNLNSKNSTDMRERSSEKEELRYQMLKEKDLINSRVDLISLEFAKLRSELQKIEYENWELKNYQKMLEERVAIEGARVADVKLSQLKDAEEYQEEIKQLQADKVKLEADLMALAKANGMLHKRNHELQEETKEFEDVRNLVKSNYNISVRDALLGNLDINRRYDVILKSTNENYSKLQKKYDKLLAKHQELEKVHSIMSEEARKASELVEERQKDTKKRMEMNSKVSKVKELEEANQSLIHQMSLLERELSRLRVENSTLRQASSKSKSSGIPAGASSRPQQPLQQQSNQKENLITSGNRQTPQTAGSSTAKAEALQSSLRFNSNSNTGGPTPNTRCPTCCGTRDREFSKLGYYKTQETPKPHNNHGHTGLNPNFTLQLPSKDAEGIDDLASLVDQQSKDSKRHRGLVEPGSPETDRLLLNCHLAKLNKIEELDGQIDAVHRSKLHHKGSVDDQSEGYEDQLVSTGRFPKCSIIDEC